MAPLTVRRKIWLGTLFLFLLLLITGGVSIFYMAKLKGDAKNVLKDNYESLSYCHTMEQQLDSFPISYKSALAKFESALEQQQNNITEKGEKEVTDRLQTDIAKLKSGDTGRANTEAIAHEVQTIMYLNTQAIKRKSLIAETSASDALTIIISLSGLLVVIAFTFIFNFSSVITEPINQLLAALKEISQRNYKYRIHIDNKDEFGMVADTFNDMAGRLENFESSNLSLILFEKSRAEAVINSLKDASIGIDKKDRILFANEQALQLLGLKAESIVNKSVEEIKKRNDLFRYLMESDNASPFKIVVDNRENYFTKEIVEVEQGDVKNKVIVLKNITSFKELDVAKTNFIATISHELKTPLASSDFSLKLLEDERISKLSGEQKELISNLKADNQRMLKILSELLNMSQVEAGRIQLNVTVVNPETIIQNAVAAIAASAKKKGITIKDTSEQNLPTLRVDADKTTWIINNLLTNAIKYSFENSVVEVNAHKQETKLIFSVVDHGPGIDKQYLPRLFEKYFQVPGSKEKGTGLGLSISKDFVEAQGGTIRAESELGKGSAFYFQLPIN